MARLRSEPAGALPFKGSLSRFDVFTHLLPSAMVQQSIVDGEVANVMACKPLCSSRFCGRREGLPGWLDGGPAQQERVAQNP